MPSKGPVLRIDIQPAYELFGPPPSSPPLMRSNMSTASTTKLRSSGRLPRRAFFKLKQGTAHVANLVRDGMRRDRIKVSVYDMDQNFDMVSSTVYCDAEYQADSVSYIEPQLWASASRDVPAPAPARTMSNEARNAPDGQALKFPVQKACDAQTTFESEALASTVASCSSAATDQVPVTGRRIIGRNDGRRNGRIFQVTHLDNMSIPDAVLMPPKPQNPCTTDAATHAPSNSSSLATTSINRRTLKRSSSEAYVDNKENLRSSSSTPVRSLKRKVARIGSERT